MNIDEIEENADETRVDFRLMLSDLEAEEPKLLALFPEELREVRNAVAKRLETHRKFEELLIRRVEGMTTLFVEQARIAQKALGATEEGDQ